MQVTCRRLGLIICPTCRNSDLRTEETERGQDVYCDQCHRFVCGMSAGLVWGTEPVTNTSDIPRLRSDYTALELDLIESEMGRRIRGRNRGGIS